MQRTARAACEGEAESAPRKTIRCSACGIAHAEENWATLPVVQQIDPPEVRRLVREWPDDLCIEVRACGRCKGPIALKRARTRGV